MTLVEFIVLLVISAICGALGQGIAGYSIGGFLASIGVGFVGALLGSWVARSFGLPELFAIQVGPNHFPVVWSIIGSALFVFIISLFTRSYRGRRYSRETYV